jgi:DNA repair exonuclease SbcCD nuclease subunit
VKILLTSDWHLDAVTAGKPRLSEACEHIEELISVVEREEVDVVAFLGDAFDPGQMLGPVYGDVISRAAGRFARAARMGTIFIAGNHDVIETSEPRSTLSPLAGIQPWVDGLFVAERPCVHDVGDVRFLLLPYVSRAATKASPDDLEIALARCSVKARSGKNLVVLSHMTIPGAVMGSESKELSRGRDLDLPSLAELEPDLVANGHYHRHQVMRHGGVDVVIPGSPLRLTFGEAGDRLKGYVVAEVG